MTFDLGYDPGFDSSLDEDDLKALPRVTRHEAGHYIVGRLLGFRMSGLEVMLRERGARSIPSACATSVLTPSLPPQGNTIRAHNANAAGSQRTLAIAASSARSPLVRLMAARVCMRRA